MLEGFINVSATLRPGIYALVRDGVVVYIGQSKKPLARISAHRSNWGRKAMPAHWWRARKMWAMASRCSSLPSV